MKRISIAPRPDWQSLVEARGLVYHTGPDGSPYWDESAYYQFTSEQIDTLEAATASLHACCLTAAQYVIEHGHLAELGIPAVAHDAIRWSWVQQERSLYGRFDLVYDGTQPPKMLEYNADTPTSLVEGAVAQWYWLQDRFPDSDQFNSVWEALVAAWKSLQADGRLRGAPLYFTALEDPEDWMTISLLRDTAEEAGIPTEEIVIDDIGWDTARRAFVDLQGRDIRSVFKLYPWEWLLKDQFGANALATYQNVQWIEPLWKFVLSSKGILPVMWRLFPGHPNLLPCYTDSPRGLTRYAAKPMIGREGANVTLHTPEGETATPGRYGDYPRVYQELCPLPDFDGHRPVIGSWVVNGEPHGIGIRESDGPITDNRSRFVPHLFEE
jgi:glutathionylspermidine synthase